MKVKKNVNLFIKFLSVNMIWVNISSLYEIQPETTPNQIHKPMSKKKKKKRCLQNRLPKGYRVYGHSRIHTRQTVFFTVKKWKTNISQKSLKPLSTVS